MSRTRIEHPQAMPIVDDGRHRGDPVAPADLELAALRRRFAAPPAWTPELHEDRQLEPEVIARPAAVLIPLISRQGGLTLLLTRRSDLLVQHRGQIAFPGGRIDPGDLSPVDAALRETHEEVGIARDQVEILGALPQYRTGTGYVITPIVGHVDPAPDIAQLKIERDEVAEVFEVPLWFLMDPANHQQRAVAWPDAAAGDAAAAVRRFYAMPWRPLPDGEAEYFIWGATAAMLRNLYRFLAART